MEKNRRGEIFRITLVGSFVNFLLVLFKFIAGIMGRSGAMLADAVHSLSDFITDIVVLLFVNLSTKPTDSDHAYGHGKYETLATTIISVVLFSVGFGLLWEGAGKIISALRGEVLEQPGVIALVAAVVSMASKEVLYHLTIKIAIRENSPSVKANAWHHRSDAFSSLGTGLGIAGAIFFGENWRILDPIAAVVVSLFILKVAIELFIPGINELLEKSVPEAQKHEILSLITSIEGVTKPHDLRTRNIGTKLAIEFHIRVNPSMTVAEAHDLTRRIERRLRERFGGETHITTHVEPIEE